MIDPFSLALIVATACLGASVIAVLYWDDVVEWFRDNGHLKQADRDRIAFTLQQKLADGEYKVVQGIFDQRNEVILAGRKVTAKEVDPRLAQQHAGRELVIYE